MSHLQFDPYRDWLGLPGPPTNFYGLLGLNLFEQDAEVIQKAAHRAKLTVRNVKPGAQTQAWKQLLDQIERGRASLSDPALRAQYDATLGSNDSTQFEVIQGEIRQRDLKDRLDPMAPLADVNSPLLKTSSAVDPLPVSTPPTPTPPTQSPPVAASVLKPLGGGLRSVESSEELATIGRSNASPSLRKATRERVRRKQKISLRLATILIGVCLMGMLFACWFILQLDPSSLRVGLNLRQSVSAPSNRSSEVQAGSGGLQAADRLTDSEESQLEAKPFNRIATPAIGKRGQRMAEPPSPEPPSPEPQKPTSSSGLGESIAAEMDRPTSLEVAAGQSTAGKPTSAQIAEARGLLVEAHRALNEKSYERGEALLKQLRSIPLGTDEEAMVERFAVLQGYVQEFWKAVDDGTKLVEGSELTLKQTTVFVVEVNSRTIVLRVLGKNRRIDRGQIPSGLAFALADRWFDQQAASTKVFKGAYMAVTPRFEVAAVKKMWSDAASEGAELADLMKVLDDRESLGVQTP